MKLGVIRVFTNTEPAILYKHGEVITEQTGLECVSRCIQDQPKGIYNQETEKIALPKIVQLAKNMEQEDGVDAIVISCAADPALSETRSAVNVQVFGAGSCGASLASARSGKIGILSITDDVPAAIKDILGSKIVGTERPEGVTNTSDLLTEEAKKSAKVSVQKLLDAGAEVILFACTGFVTIGFSNVLRREFNVDVVDPVEAEGYLAHYFINK